MTQELVNEFLEKGYLISPDLISSISSDFDFHSFLTVLDNNWDRKNKPLVINTNMLVLSHKENKDLQLNWNDFDKSRVLLEKGRDDKIYQTFIDLLNYNISPKKKKAMDKILDTVSEPIKEPLVISQELTDSSVVVLNSYNKPSKKKEMKDFVYYLRARYNSLRGILQGRQELQNTISINRLNKNMEGESTALIGVVLDKRETKNGNLIVTLEDPSGTMNVLINKNKPDLFEMGKDIVLDEIIGITGNYGDKIVFVNGVYFPGIPITKEFKKFDQEVYALFTADLHIGSDMFLKDDFLKFIQWVNGETGTKEQREIAKKTKYLFIIGDLVDGVGIYPEQNKELLIKDIYEQYEVCAELLGKIRKDVQIIICGGNHDALRLAEPQPVLDKRFSNALWNLPNVIIVSNPAILNIHSSKDFPGFDVLLYHGSSFFYFADKVDSIRVKGGADRIDLIMKFLLEKRHLAPTHSSTLYIPDVEEDPLVIDKVPDFFVTGHLHRTSFVNYKNVSLIGCGCWQSQTAHMEKLGVVPDPSRVNLVNLKTREVKILKFGDE